MRLGRYEIKLAAPTMTPFAPEPADAPQIDPRDEVIVFETTRGELDDLRELADSVPELRAHIEELTSTITRLMATNRDMISCIAGWEQTWDRTMRIQQRAVRRLFRMPKVLGKVLEAASVGEGIVLGDGTVRFVIMGPDNPWVELEVLPFDARLRVIDASGKEADLLFDLDNDGPDIYRAMLLQLIGFGNVAKRNADQTSATLLEQVNTVLTPDAEPNTPQPVFGNITPR